MLLGEDGQPTMLITVCRLLDKLPNTAPCPSFPSGEAQYVTRVVMQPIGGLKTDDDGWRGVTVRNYTEHHDKNCCNGAGGRIMEGDLQGYI